jgi:hypothetical protein
MVRRALLFLALTACALLTQPPTASATELRGLYNGSLDQPQINAIVRPTASESFLSMENDFLSDDPLFGNLDPVQYTIPGFFDTGASNTLFGDQTAAEFNIPKQAGATYKDFGAGGEAKAFDITQSLEIRLAPFGTGADVNNPDAFDNPEVYGHTYPNQRAAVMRDDETGDGTVGDDNIGRDLDRFLNLYRDFNVYGMPLMQGKTVAMDARGLNDFLLGDGSGDDLTDAANAQISTTVHQANEQPGTYDPSLPTPAPDRRIQTNLSDFTQFTETIDGDAPNLATNPFIGANPVLEQLGAASSSTDAPTPGVKITRNGQSNTGSWLFDTGAAATIISEGSAQDVNVQYVDGREPGNAEGLAPQLEEQVNGSWQPIDSQDQFTLTIQGVDGQLEIAGFWLDSMTLPTKSAAAQGQPHDYSDPRNLKFVGDANDPNAKGVPVLVHDITVTKPNDPTQQVTLDGILGMNNFFASALIDGGIGDPNEVGTLPLLPGFFDSMTFNQSTGEIGLSFDRRVIPEPASALLLLGGAPLLLRRRRR